MLVKVVKNMINFDKDKNFVFNSEKFPYIEKFDITSS